MYDRNALRRYLEMGGRPEDLGMSVDPMTGEMQEPPPQGNALRSMLEQGNVLSAPQNYDMGGQPVASINGDFKILAGDGQPQSVDLTPAVQEIARQRAQRQAQGPTGGPLRVVGAGNGTTVELSPEVAPASVDLDYSRPAVDVPGVGKVFYDKSGRGAYAVDGSGRPTAKVILGYDDAGSRARTRENLASDATRAQIAHTDASTAQLGQPNYQLTPEGDVFNPKTGQVASRGAQSGVVERGKQKAAYESGLKELQKDDTQVASLSQLEQAYKRWAELQAQVSTGRVMGHLPAVMNPERQELLQLENFLAANNFKPGQGAISNFERGLIKGSGPNVLNDPEANMDIVRIGMGSIQNMRDRSQFREAYLQQNGKLLGSDQAWQRYLEENPRFVRDRSGVLVENPNRQDWQTYFANGGSQVRPEMTPPIAQNIPPAAIDFLKRNPAAAADFDRKYGPGAAQRALGR